ncbi:uncharacterized protein DS421_1g10520 [Arachis hypogaea]|nr:uncharacterized protein DS421_1g10520 [Arachis hypogaea]
MLARRTIIISDGTHVDVLVFFFFFVKWIGQIPILSITTHTLTHPHFEVLSNLIPVSAGVRTWCSLFKRQYDCHLI